MAPTEIHAWSEDFRRESARPFQINLWVPDPAPHRDVQHEAQVRAFLSKFGPPVPEAAGDAVPPDFASQCDAILAVKPPVVSSVMGLYSAAFVEQIHRRGLKWFATVTTVTEAIEAEAAGADVIVAQGMEAGGHRGAFKADLAERQLIGLFALIPAIVDRVRTPVIAAGGIADARGIAAALHLGASAVQIGTGLLRTPEAKIPRAWADALAGALPEHTMITRAFSGRAGRSIATEYVLAAAEGTAPKPAPYPVQRGLTAAMRAQAHRTGELRGIQAWSGQSAALAQSKPAGELVRELWDRAQELLA
jgi:nitronate monooxygenase